MKGPLNNYQLIQFGIGVIFFADLKKILGNLSLEQVMIQNQFFFIKKRKRRTRINKSKNCMFK